MGCFSFICKKSGEAVLSSSFSGDAVHLFLLKDGKVIEHMFGNYDSYGRVFKKELRTDVEHELHEAFDWDMEWGDVCDLVFDKNKNNGIAAILAPYSLFGILHDTPYGDIPIYWVSYIHPETNQATIDCVGWYLDDQEHDLTVFSGRDTCYLTIPGGH